MVPAAAADLCLLVLRRTLELVRSAPVDPLLPPPPAPSATPAATAAACVLVRLLLTLSRRRRTRRRRRGAAFCSCSCNNRLAGEAPGRAAGRALARGRALRGRRRPRAALLVRRTGASMCLRRRCGLLSRPATAYQLLVALGLRIARAQVLPEGEHHTHAKLERLLYRRTRRIARTRLPAVAEANILFSVALVLLVRRR